MTVTAQVNASIARYTPEIAAQLRGARASLRKQIPRGYELVYDNYNALVFAFGPTPRPSQLVMSIAGYPRWVTLFFANGKGLEDPEGLLQGTGRSIRSLRLSPFTILKSRAVQALVRSALAQETVAFAQAPPLTTVMQSISSKQLSRRPQAQRGSRD
jgi:hypothetical protein